MSILPPLYYLELEHKKKFSTDSNFKNIYFQISFSNFFSIFLKAIKARWASSPEISELDQFFLKPFIRGDYLGKILVHYEAGYPQYYFGAKLK